MFSRDYDVKSLQTWLNYLRQFLNVYEWLANSFVLDHFVNCHWDSLPRTWQEFLCQLPPAEFSHWILTGRVRASGQNVSPASLSLTSLRASVEVLSLRRDFEETSDQQDLSVDEKVLKLLNRHVKPKKQHEVRHMSKLIQKLSTECGGVKNLVDVGSGLGHLCRFLSFGLGFNTIGIDSDSDLGITAKEFSAEVEKNVKKLSAKTKDLDAEEHSLASNHHINKYLLAGDRISHDEEFGLVGLHGCGDLGGIIVQNFVQNPRAKFVAFASCCYMKIKDCYPLSQFLRSDPIPLKYEALELSCHAKELYVERLRNPADVDKLKTHCYRATLETLLVKHGFVKVGLKTVKNNHLMDFGEYARKATQKLEIDIQEDLESKTTEISCMLQEWTKVVYFYTLRVMIAPVIETAVLLDRALFVIENGCSCKLTPLFDPRKSPRNIVIIGKKQK